MAEVSAIDMARGDVELGHSRGHSACHTRPDDQRDQFDQGKESSNAQQDVDHAPHEFAERGKQVSVQNRRPGHDL